MKKKQNDVLEKKKEESLATVSFLEALNENLDSKTAFKVASDAFAKYMIKFYEKILKSTKKNSQERFDKFRHFYEEYAKKTPYLKIIKSTSNLLQVKYERCPFYEILIENNIPQLAYAFCLSDLAFTVEVLPGVKFSRTSEIAKGGLYCDNTWEFNNTIGNE